MHPIEMVNTLVRVLWSYTLFWIFCSCGGMVTTRFNTFDDELYQCQWYALPMEAQQLLMIFMANTQKPTTIRGYGNVVCSRRTFQRVNIIRWCSEYSAHIYLLIRHYHIRFHIIPVFFYSRQSTMESPIF